MTAPLFIARCTHCAEIVPNRPEPHVCRPEWAREDDETATPWRNRG